MSQSKAIFNARIDKLRTESLISIDELKASTVMDYNIDPVKILPHVVTAQKLVLEPLLGSKLYRKLQEDNLTFEYQTLLDNHVYDFLVHLALSEYLRNAFFSVQQGGIYIHTSSDSEAISSSELKLIVENEKSKAEQFKNRMIAFIEKYPTYYSEFSECIGDGIKARNVRYLTGGWNTSPSYVPNASSPSYSASCSGVGECTADDSIFTTTIYWGNNNIDTIGFDPTTLSNTDNVLPNEVTLQPVNSWAWIVTEIDTEIDLYQMDLKIPMGDFSSPTQNSEIFVKGADANYNWIRVSIENTYESPVTFKIKKV